MMIYWIKLLTLIILLVGVCLPVDKKSTQSTIFEKKELNTIRLLAWQPYKWMVKDGIFMTKDIAVLKAKLMMFDYYFGDSPYNNRYFTDIKKTEEKIKRMSRILAIAIPTSVVLFTGMGFSMGFRLSMRLN